MPVTAASAALSLKYMFDPLDTEFGAYFMNYHSRAPIFSGHGAPASAYSRAGWWAALAGPLGVRRALAPLAAIGRRG